ncbi:chorismate lyase [Thiomicrorhabdus sp.]|uniref:chorismate--pyruvate lyase family protein n=1 Tax=Thiomicrorhabdus sp. TaxID=2039724 RepID=UPI0029C6F552|nr:chorismate lyase [Thiomicrorhabdus sp.]
MSATERLAKIKRLLQEKQGVSSIKPQFWKPPKLIHRVASTPLIRSWLTTPTSLTARMRTFCPGLEVEILSETFEVPLFSELARLGMPPDEEAWVRCVLLKCGQGPWVYARTVIPHLDTLNPWHDLKQLGTQPLGEVLFNLPNIERTPFEFSKDTLGHWPHLNRLVNNTGWGKQSGYARRSVFLHQKAPLLLTEVFLPNLFDSVSDNR